MAAFGLDDVRESYTSDVTRFLSDVETHAHIVVSAASLAMNAERAQQPLVDAMVVGLHGIVGSSSLIGLDTMTGSARRLENLAASAAESIRIMARHAARLQRIAAICLDSAVDLRAILDHELAGRTGEARGRCTALHLRLDQQTPSLDHVPGGINGAAVRAVGSEIAGSEARSPALAQDSTADRGWDDAIFTSGPASVAAPPQARGGAAGAAPAADADDELGQAFRDEARETLTHLQGYGARLEHDPDDHDAAAHCARLLHLLRGSAAMVGREAVMRRTGELHAWLETVRRQGFTHGAVAELGRGIEELVALALGERLEPAPAPLPPPPSMAPVADAELRQIFVEETGRELDELRTLAAQLDATAGPARDAAANRAERVLHRLKGSALIVGEPRLGELAARGQALCEPPDQVDGEALGALIRRLAAELTALAAARDLVLEPHASSAPAITAFRFSPPSAEEWDAFLGESSDLLDDLDRALARLEQNVRPAAELSAMFRMYHTLKGASSSVGLAPIAQQLHAMESFVERIVAAPELPPLRAVVTALADEHAAMRANIGRAASHGSLQVDPGVNARFAAIGDRAPLSHASWIAPNDPVWATPVFDAGDPDAHASRSHASRLVASEAAPADAEAAPDGEPALGRRFVRVAADRLDGLLDLVGELVVARSRMLTRIARLQQLQDEEQDRQGAVIRLVDDFATATEFTNLDGGRGGSAGRGRRPGGGGGFGALELDHYEEIHILSRQLEEAASDIQEMRRALAVEMQQLTEDADALSTVIADLQGEITQARMLTVEALFTRLQLPIRDAAQRLGREVSITTHGGQVAIDKAISDALFAPLLHIVRNAVVHGIEEPQHRSALGKPRAGGLALSARQDHGQVVLEITDDGQGIDVARLKAAGVARGLIDPATPDSDPRVLELVFVHGLSTADEAGDVAGRGVGGNVIRRAIDRLSGSIEISTARGSGTTFRIALPLSMSITQAVVVRAAAVTLAIPIAFAERILAREGVESVDTFGRTRVRIGGNLMPVHHTARLFGGAGASDGGVLVVCTVGAERIAIQADAVVGQEEIVVKSLGSLLDGHPLFSGSTQRGDGELVLILDVPGVLASETSDGQAFDPAARAGGAWRDQADPPFGAASQASAGDASGLGLGRDASHASRTTADAGDASRTVAAPTSAPPAPDAGPLAELAPVPAGRRRVLFVDDSLSVRKVAERMLRSLGADVVTAIDGQDALDKLRTTAFSLVFTDLEMPRLHGYDLIREMQYLPVYRATPVVVISSRSGQKHIEQALAMGAREYLTKPFSLEILHGVLDRWAALEPAA